MTHRPSNTIVKVIFGFSKVWREKVSRRFNLAALMNGYGGKSPLR